MIYNIAIDADSLAYKSCYRHMYNTETGKTFLEMDAEEKRTDKHLLDVNMELAYFEFCGEINKICSSLFVNGEDGIIQYQSGDSVKPLIVFSPRKSFRNDISPSGVKFTEITRGKNKGKMKDMGYKANRDTDAWSVPRIRDLKNLVLERLSCIMHTENLFPGGSKAEADDVVNFYARIHNYFVAAIDKDVINANPTYTRDYNKNRWELPRQEHQIDQWYLVQTLMGDTTDNVAGAPGIGEKSARDIVYGTYNGNATYEDIIKYFETDLDCMINHTLVRMDGFNGKEIIPFTP